MAECNKNKNLVRKRPTEFQLKSSKKTCYSQLFAFLNSDHTAQKTTSRQTHPFLQTPCSLRLCFHQDNFSWIKSGKSGNTVKTLRLVFSELTMPTVLTGKNIGFSRLYDRKLTQRYTTWQAKWFNLSPQIPQPIAQRVVREACQTIWQNYFRRVVLSKQTDLVYL